MYLIGCYSTFWTISGLHTQYIRPHFGIDEMKSLWHICSDLIIILTPSKPKYRVISCGLMLQLKKTGYFCLMMFVRWSEDVSLLKCSLQSCLCSSADFNWVYREWIWLWFNWEMIWRLNTCGWKFTFFFKLMSSGDIEAEF